MLLLLHKRNKFFYIKVTFMALTWIDAIEVFLLILFILFVIYPCVDWFVRACDEIRRDQHDNRKE